MTEPLKIPKELFSRKNLEVLNLSGYPYENGNSSWVDYHLPPQIAQLPTLKKLKLSSTNLLGLPKELATLKKLEELDLSNNRHMSEFPLVITQLENLRVLRLKNVWISVLPREITRLTNLQLLDLTDTHIGEIHDDIIPFLKRIKLVGGMDLDLRQEDPSTFTADRMVEVYKEGENTPGHDTGNFRFMLATTTRPETITGAHLAQMNFGSPDYAGDGMLGTMSRPETIDISFIVEQLNATTRSKLIDKIGIERFIRESGAIKYDEDKSGILWRRVMRQFVEGDMGAKAYSYETDDIWQAVQFRKTKTKPKKGYRQTYFVEVPGHIESVFEASQPKIETVQEAVARIAEMTPKK